MSGARRGPRRVAVVTGAARGIGLAVAERLARDGHRVALADLDEQTLGRARDSMPGSLAFAGDVRDPVYRDRVLGQTEAALGPIGILVNNAGVVGRTGPIEAQRDSDWETTLGVLLTATFQWSRAVVPSMKRTGWGRIVNIASVAGKEGNPNLIPYSVAKAGVICLAKALAKEVAANGVLVNAIAPAVINTDLLKTLPNHQVKYMLERIPLGRPGEPAEVADAVSFLVESGTFTTGQTLDLSGGRCTY